MTDVRKNYLLHYVVYALLAGFFTCGCMSKLKRAQKIEICKERCEAVEGLVPQDQEYAEVYRLLKKNEGNVIEICDSGKNRAKCKRKGILVYWQGGWIPGPAYVKSIKISKVAFGEAKQEITFNMEFEKKNFIWIPFFCSASRSNLTVNKETNFTFKSTGALCNWAGFGIFVLNLYVSIDYIDFKNEMIGGNYKLNGGGPLNGGGGTGHMLMKFNSFGSENSTVADKKSGN